MDIVIYRIVNVSGLLMHNPIGLAPTKSTLGTKKKNYDPDEDAEAVSYRNEAGQLILPTSHFRGSMLKASTHFKVGKMAAKGVFASSVFPVEDSVILVDPKSNKPLTKYKVDTRRAVVQRASILRSRPLVESWACDLALEVDMEMLPNLEHLTQILNRAGKVAGVGDFAPRNGGPFGRFTASLKD
jgi:hypothetical protein